MHPSITKNTHNTKSTHKKTLKPGLVTSYDIRPGNGVGLQYPGRMGRDGKARK